MMMETKAKAHPSSPDFSKTLLPVVGFLGIGAGIAVLVAVLITLLRMSAQ